MLSIFQMKEELTCRANPRDVIDELKAMYLRDSRIWIAATSHEIQLKCNFII
ncbi:hypothetical protein PAECIP111802_05002 [Paenibacillus allorhizosphaerae]|uniref:Uncharacterized protein n=1 Tax=Paenibacillus allorhizosphaerae TaxID=2849866 RepID=A0ABM8VNP8_9BACL|nr:hypothetical protein PAECIP111802_05002 [Paenibacillus allorhizosphaerae]